MQFGIEVVKVSHYLSHTALVMLHILMLAAWIALLSHWSQITAPWTACPL